MSLSYDIIGDIHGHAEEFVTLLRELGYEESGGVFCHPSRRAIFVGDFIDRGPEILRVLRMVKAMCDAGTALAIMGNHEFNAINFHTEHPRGSGHFLREHSDKNVHQHQETLRQVPATLMAEYLDWFRRLPLWLDLPRLHVVHACWHPPSMKTIRDCGLVVGSESFFAGAGVKPSSLRNAVANVLTGLEAPLPVGSEFKDKDGHVRRDFRVRWFAPTAGQTLRSYSLPEQDVLPAQPLSPEIVESAVPYGSSEPPVFFGHYWLRAENPVLLAPNVACVDYSVAKGGMLCCYRWDGEQVLDQSKFVTVLAS